MSYRFTVLSLAAVLVVLPGLTPIAGTPAPASARAKSIYALIYVGLGKNDKDNAKRVADAIDDLRGSGARGAVRDPEVNALPIVRKKEKELGWIGRDRWAESKTQVASLEGTAVVRVWFTDGSPKEQVLIVNAIVSDYVEPRQKGWPKAVTTLRREKANFKKQQEDAWARYTEEDEKVFQRREEALKPPLVLEWAHLAEKP